MKKDNLFLSILSIRGLVMLWKKEEKEITYVEISEQSFAMKMYTYLSSAVSLAAMLHFLVSLFLSYYNVTEINTATSEETTYGVSAVKYFFSDCWKNLVNRIQDGESWAMFLPCVFGFSTYLLSFAGIGYCSVMSVKQAISNLKAIKEKQIKVRVDEFFLDKYLIIILILLLYYINGMFLTVQSTSYLEERVIHYGEVGIGIHLLFIDFGVVLGSLTTMLLAKADLQKKSKKKAILTIVEIFLTVIVCVGTFTNDNSVESLVPSDYPNGFFYDLISMISIGFRSQNANKFQLFLYILLGAAVFGTSIYSPFVLLSYTSDDRSFQERSPIYTIASAILYVTILIPMTADLKRIRLSTFIMDLVLLSASVAISILNMKTAEE